MKKMLLIDGNSLLFRAYYATCYTRMMKTSFGMPTNAVFAFSTMMDKAISMINPDYMLVAFDKGKHTFRHDLYSDYKGGRKKTPDELVMQFSLVRDFLKAYNIPYLELDNIEADDIIGSMAYAHPELDINILTSDRDLLQIIDDTTSVWLMIKGITNIKEMTKEALVEEVGILPSQITDLKGLMGDSADNIKGVDGVGDKTALKLLLQYKTIENLYDHIDELKGKLKEKLINGKESAFLSKMIATIKKDVQIDLKLDDLKYNPTYDELIKFYNKYEMKSLAKNINVEHEDVSVKANKVNKVSLDLLNDNTVLYFDHDYFSYYKPNVYGIALSNGLKSEYIFLQDALNDQDFLNYLKSDKRKIVFDLKACLHLLDYLNIELNGFVYDTLLASFLINNKVNDFDSALLIYDLKDTSSIIEIYGKENKQKLPDEDLQIKFSINRSNLIYKMYKDTVDEIENLQMHQLFYDVELPLVYVLYRMEKEGICCDINVLDEISNETLAKMNYYQDKIYKYVNKEFNLNSPKQLGEVLFDELGLPTNKKRSTSKEVLDKLIGKHPIIEDILSYRKYAKLYSTYAEGLKKYIFKDNKIHTIYNQCLTQTGRLSSVEPNLQNISVRDEEGREIRKAFLASSNHILVSSDYSQVELRMLAHLANEETLIDAFKNKMDIHTKTAMDVFNVKEDEVTSNLRRQAKAVNFGIVYGMSDYGLAEQIGVEISDAKIFIENYFNKYSAIKNYMDNIVKHAKDEGYVKTILNRRRYIPELSSSNYMLREFGKRAAMNTPIQGSAADLIKIAMVKIDEKMRDLNVKSKMILQVHDELIFDVDNDEIELMHKIILEGMENAMDLKVPLVADTNEGKSWYDAK